MARTVHWYIVVVFRSLLLLFSMLFVSLSHADRMPCQSRAELVYPEMDAIDVPTLVAPAAILVYDCGSSLNVLASVWVVESGEMVYSESVRMGSTITDLPLLSLEPLTAYGVRFEGEGFFSSAEAFFSTGEEEVGPAVTPVELRIESFRGTRGSSVFESEMLGSLREASEHPVRVVSSVGAESLLMGSQDFHLEFTHSNPRVCVTAEVRVASGWVSGEEVCARVVEVRFLGCSSAGSWGLFLGPLSLLLVRRRRR